MDARCRLRIGCACHLVCGLAACGAPALPAAPSTPHTASSTNTDKEPSHTTTLPADAIRMEDRDVMTEVSVALHAAGSNCLRSAEEPGVVICDQNNPNLPTLVLVYHKPMLFFLSHFRRKPDKSCEAVLETLNKLNSSVDTAKLVCDEDRVTFASTLFVPSYGLAPVDVEHYAEGFRQTVQLVLRTSGLAEVLQ